MKTARTVCALILVATGLAAPTQARLALQPPQDGPRRGEGRFVFVACSGKTNAFTHCGPFDAHEEVYEQRGDFVARLTGDDTLKRWLVWSPDQSHLAFSGPWGLSSDAECPAYSTPLHGRTRKVLEDDGWSCVKPVDWSPGGRWILLNFSYIEGPSNLFRVRPDGTQLERVTCFMYPGAMGTSGGFFVDGGKRVIFVASNKNARNGIYSIDSDGKHQRLLYKANTYAYDLSPDQQRFVFATIPEGEANGEIYSMLADGSGVRRLTFNDTQEVGVAFSPDGTRVAFGVAERPYERPYALSVVDVVTGEITEVPLPGGTRLAASDFRLAWSPDGTRVAFEAATVQPRRNAIYWSDPERKTTARATDFFPAMSLWGWLPTHVPLDLERAPRAHR